MKDVLANHADPKNKDIIVSAFGQHAYDNHLKEITDNVEKIDNTKMKVRLATGSSGIFKDPSTSASTNWIKDSSAPGGYKGKSVSFGKPFYGTLHRFACQRDDRLRTCSF